jgi:tRNA nucleotidyltransferase (CCA-adding enzyme)
MELITCHINADFDAFASMVAAKRLYPEAEAVFPGSQEKKLRDFLASFGEFRFKRLKDIDVEAVSRLIVVDTKSPGRLGPIAALLERPGIEVILFDHHEHEEGDIHGTLEVIDEVGATSTIFTEILEEKGIKPTPMEATALCLGIHEETGSFTFAGTTERDMRAAARLLRWGASLKIVSSYMRTEMSRLELDLLNALSHSATEVSAGGLRVLIAKASTDIYVGDAAHMAHRMADMEQTDAVVLMIRMEDKIVMVGRSRSPELNMAHVLRRFGGGGHPTAAAATLKEMPLELLEEELRAVLEDVAKPGKFASDIMSRQVITIDAESTIKEAESSMTRYGVNVLPVVREGMYTGLISRENVEKAIFHGLGKSAVTEFATTDAGCADRYTPIRQIESIMVERNQRFVPVVELGRIRGAITRTDILRSMYEDYLRRSGIKDASAERKAAPGKKLASWIEGRLPAETFGLLKTAGEIADGLDYNAYLVGGSVRDLLMGQRNIDMDLVIEGEGIEFARQLGQVLGAKVRPHERFGTAKIIRGDMRIDVATARTEYYERPAALPKVQMSSVKKDLYRRDFTINSLAVMLKPGEFGQMVDFFGGQRDLKDKAIRVLHNLSFVEDPTRAFRAARFAVRFGFRISKHTENLIRSALNMDLFGKLSGKRLYEEMSLIFGEKNPVGVIRVLADYKLLSVIHPRLMYSERLHARLTATHDTLRWFELSFIDESADYRVMYLMALLYDLKSEEKEKALRRLSVPPRLQRAVVGDVQSAKGILGQLPISDPAGLYEALSALNLETLLFAMSEAEDGERKKCISKYLLELRRTKTLLGGSDLKKMGIEPGPIYSSMLKDLLFERLRGNLRSLEDEKQYVERRIQADGASGVMP